MNTSGGGGFCDCGDTEAWKDGVSCDTHQRTRDTDMEEVLYTTSNVTYTVITAWLSFLLDYWARLFESRLTLIQD